jgi:hypothetical protein
MSYYVYVIELDKEVIKSKKFRRHNPSMNPKRTCFYVGQSCHDPIVRFMQHKKGYKANRFARLYGLRLHWKKFQKYNPIKNRKQAEDVEQKLTEKLRRKGHGVWSH